MSQLSYAFNPAIGRAGMVAEMREDTIILSKVAEGLVKVGLLAAAGTRGEVGMSPTTANPYSTSPGQVKGLPAGIVDDPILDSEWFGVPVYDASRAPYTANDEYSATDQVPVLRKGAIWVYAESSVTQMTDVYVRVTAGGGFDRGSWRAGAAANFVKFAKGRWMTTTTAAGLAILEIG